MLIPLLIYWVLTKMILAVDSAPLENGIFDPLVSIVDASDGYLSNEMPLLRKDISPEELIDRGPYDGYIFNQKRCIQFNNRILCGYDRNQGTKLDDYTMLDIGSGCRSRGDRIECGYANPRLYKNLRLPGIEHGEHEEHDEHNEHNEHDKFHEKRHHHVGHHHHKGNHHHEDKDQDSLARQAPTRTAMTMNPTSHQLPATNQSIILNRIKTDYLENKLLKTAFDKLLMKSKNTSKGSMKTTTDLTKPIKSSTDRVKPLTTTTTKQTMHTLTSKRQKYKTTTSKATTRTSTTKITTTLPTSSESNDISDGETIKRIVKLAPVIKQKRRQLTERLLKLPKLVSKFISDGTVVPPITNNCETTSNRAVLRKKTTSEEKVKTACVERGDRVVCYDFKT